MHTFDDIDTALRGATSKVERCDDARWKGTLVNGVTLWTTVHATGDWLLLRTPAAPPRDAAAAVGPLASQLVQWNAHLHGGTRFALRPCDVLPEIRAEIALDDAVDLGARLAEVWAGFMEGAALLRGEPWQDHLGAADLGSPPPARDLVAICRDTGWLFVERSPQRLAVDLDIPGGYRQATVEDSADPEGTLRVSVDLECDEAPLLPACRAAVDTLLLEACASIRFTRAATSADPNEPARFECVFSDGATSAELAHAFSALSVAYRLCVDEVRVLQRDEALATRFLALRNGNDESP